MIPPWIQPLVTSIGWKPAVMPFVPPSRQACPWSVHWRYSSGFRTISFLPPLTNCPGSFLLCGDSLAPASSYFLLVGLVEAPATTRRLRRVRFCSLATSLCCFHDLKLSQRSALSLWANSGWRPHPDSRFSMKLPLFFGFSHLTARRWSGTMYREPLFHKTVTSTVPSSLFVSFLSVLSILFPFCNLFGV